MGAGALTGPARAPSAISHSHVRNMDSCSAYFMNCFVRLLVDLKLGLAQVKQAEVWF